MKYSHYKEVEAAAETLDAQEKFEEELLLLRSVETRFPNYRFENLWTQALILRHIDQNAECYELIATLIGDGYFMPLEGEYWQPLHAIDGFDLLQKESERLKVAAQAKARMEYAVHLPEGYSGEQRYPLFFVLHGDAGNIEQLAWHWPPEAMTKLGLIAVYVQSSQVRNSRNFIWLPDPQIARRDLKDAYDQVTSQYAADPARVIVGGFSGGAITALDITLADVFLIKGFLCQSPSRKPKDFSSKNVSRAAKRGVRGVFMEGELAIPVADEQAMMQAFDEAGLSYQFYINQGLGHEIPPDLPEKLEQVVRFIMS